MSAVTVQHRVFPDVLAPAIMFQCQCVASHLPVSILTRPVGRVQRACPVPNVQSLGGFNPHPARGPSATPTALPSSSAVGSGFNPHPARGPSATRCRWPRRSPPRGFNPHPARGPSATCLNTAVSILTRPVGRVHRTQQFAAARMFQSSPGPWAECNGTVRNAGHPVSILTRPVGRVQVAWNGAQRVSILTRPVGRVQPAPERNQRSVFQSSPGPWAECNGWAAAGR